jgi:hypothetical protein
LVLAGTLALIAAPPAPAKCCALTTPPAPADLHAAEEWVAQMEVHGDPEYWPDEAPTLIAWSDSTRKLVSVQAKQSGRRLYHARVVFPEPGRWSYAVTFGGFGGSASAPIRTVTVAPRPSRAFDVALSALLVLTAGALAGVVRGRRWGLSPVGTVPRAWRFGRGRQSP